MSAPSPHLRTGTAPRCADLPALLLRPHLANRAAQLASSLGRALSQERPARPANAAGGQAGPSAAPVTPSALSGVHSSTFREVLWSLAFCKVKENPQKSQLACTLPEWLSDLPGSGQQHEDHQHVFSFCGALPQVLTRCLSLETIEDSTVPTPVDSGGR